SGRGERERWDAVAVSRVPATFGRSERERPRENQRELQYHVLVLYREHEQAALVSGWRSMRIVLQEPELGLRRQGAHGHRSRSADRESAEGTALFVSGGALWLICTATSRA